MRPGQYVKRLGLIAFAAVLAVGTWMSVPGLVVHDASAATGCQLTQIAFCDTFDAPAANTSGTRSGDLNPVIWGASRSTSDDNPSQGSYYNWNSSHLDKCGSSSTVGTPRDIQICSNGTLVESMSDQGSVTMLAMYPKQPFDFAGRTGKVVMDLSNDTEGSHMAWPEIIITDQPVPVPSEDSAGVADFARNSFGIALGQDCNNGTFVNTGNGNSWGISSVWTTSNYGFQLQNFTSTGCALRSNGPGSPLNHVELRISSNHFELWASDAGSSTLKQIGTGNFQMPLTRGLVWMEDVHYNACKEPGDQCDHTFAWDNFGFDGPILPRDLTFDVPDAHQGSSGNLGYFVPANTKITLPINNVSNISNASAALLTLTWYAREQASVTYSLNGHASHTTPWPFGNEDLSKSKTIAIPVALSDLVQGTNSLTLSTSQSSFGGASVANIDLILVGAGGTPGGGGGSQPTATPVPPTPTPAVATATPAPVTVTPLPATATAVPPTATTAPTNTPIAQPTSTPTTRPTNTPTARPTNTPTTRPTNTPTATPTSGILPPLPLPTLPLFGSAPRR